MFKIYKNISHKVIWQAIQYLKLANCKKFYLGVTKSIYSKSLISDKEKVLIFLNLLLVVIKIILLY